jgi:hypothetical protein
MKDGTTQSVSRRWPALAMILGLGFSLVSYGLLGPPLSGPTATFGLVFFCGFVSLYLLRWLIAVLRSERTADYMIYIALLILSPILISLLAELLIRVH